MTDILAALERVKGELRNRRRFEIEMERRLGDEWEKQRKEFMRLLGNPPDLSNVPETYWNNGGKAIRKVISSVLEDVYLIQAFGLAEQVNLAVDWMLVNQHAIDWAARWGMQKATELNGRTREMVVDLVQKYYTESWDLDELTRRISIFYAPERARTVAITETTNAAVQSQIQMADDLKQIYNVQFKEVWKTNIDDRTCEVCEPKDGHPVSEVGYPPEHVNCRCYVEYELI